ncbi:MAG: hypothetical protein HOV68_25065 [Streptomycetaceae bacterium]|nr:hypothetical protein [Streptomycetaceae bacterium]
MRIASVQDICREVLAGVKQRYREHNGHIKVAPVGGDLSAVDVFDRYGVGFLERVHENGSAPIPAGN